MNRIMGRILLLVCCITITGCGWQMATKAVMPASIVTYNNAFDATKDMIIGAGYTVSYADAKTGTISGTKHIDGASLNFNAIVKKEAKDIVINVVREGGKYPLPNSIWKLDARNGLKELAKKLNVPENKVTVTMNDETETLDKF